MVQQQNAPGREKKDRVKTSKGVGAVIKVKAVTGVTVSKAMILQKLEKVTKDSFASELLSDKIKTFMVEEVAPLSRLPFSFSRRLSLPSPFGPFLANSIPSMTRQTSTFNRD